MQRMERRDFLKSAPFIGAVGFAIKDGKVDTSESVHSAIKLELGWYIFLVNPEHMDMDSFCESNLGEGISGVVFAVRDVENALRVIKL